MGQHTYSCSTPVSGGVARGRAILRGRVSYGIILRCLSGVVLEGLGVVTDNYASCCCEVRQRRCGLVSPFLSPFVRFFSHPNLLSLAAIVPA
jgi:hypothetical protein